MKFKSFNAVLLNRANMFANEKNIDTIRLQGVSDAMYNIGFNKGFGRGYFLGIMLTLSLGVLTEYSIRLGKKIQKQRDLEGTKIIIESLLCKNSKDKKDDEQLDPEDEEAYEEAEKKYNVQKKEEETEDGAGDEA